MIHGFMPRAELEKRGFSFEVVDLLESTFPIRLNLYNGKPLRQEMVEVAAMLSEMKPHSPISAHLGNGTGAGDDKYKDWNFERFQKE